MNVPEDEFLRLQNEKYKIPKNWYFVLLNDSVETQIKSINQKLI